MLVSIASALVAVWGISHLIPARQVVAGIGEISPDNRRVLTMEWVAEGLTMIFAGVLIGIVTAVAGPNDHVAIAVYLAIAGLLAGIALLTTLTGARTPVVWFEACPLVMLVAIALIVSGSVL